jgi:hypothetical protein
LELDAAGSQARDRAQVERAFNVLAHPEIRSCYDAMRNGEDAPAVFPYGGFGSILVEGDPSEDGEAFFANRILAYKPEMTSRRLSLLLRGCEFFADRVICRDPKRKVEVWLDANLLSGLDWDLTWNQWKHWLKSRIEVEATLVHAGKYRLRKGEWILRQLCAALPSRLRVRLPTGSTPTYNEPKRFTRCLVSMLNLSDGFRMKWKNGRLSTRRFSSGLTNSAPHHT